MIRTISGAALIALPFVAIGYAMWSVGGAGMVAAVVIVTAAIAMPIFAGCYLLGGR